MRAVALSRGEQEEHSNYQRGGTIKANNLTEDIFRTKSGEAGSIQRSTGSSENLPSTESHTIPEAAPRFVERRTGLRGQGIAPAWISPRTIRKNTEDELKERVARDPVLQARASPPRSRLLPDGAAGPDERGNPATGHRSPVQDGRSRSGPACAEEKEKYRRPGGTGMTVTIVKGVHAGSGFTTSGIWPKRLPSRLRKKVALFEQKIAKFPQRRWA